jgi:hypothetical protein
LGFVAFMPVEVDLTMDPNPLSVLSLESFCILSTRSQLNETNTT